MKAVTTILLTLTTLAFAAPNPAVLSTRQEAECSNWCQCIDGLGRTLSGPSKTCCVNGTLSDDDTCGGVAESSVETYQACCALNSGYPICQSCGE
ncbi:uncharacterized protein B0H64DRAFT_470140 [Chaetomium fimeti]|uniref:Extracellular membrane protein CFEM domain-containing protein n=1 Tax=Chaetomium fimeti TaxID=1854472 RepID=A0AAE0LWC9_9PEZI|nr:hypothetical protein B0H64DRAFT_470140 [Chaetomium fimeti]